MPDDKPRDVALIGPPTEDGQGRKVLRARDDRLELGEVRALAEGKPIHGEVVTLKPRTDAPWVCDVETTVPAPAAAHPAAGAAKAGTAGPKKGPAQVASPRYRSNWDAIFGAAPEPAPEARTDENPAARKLLN